MALTPQTNEEFLAWIAENPDGYVVNHEHDPSSAYLILHHSTCYHFQDDRDFTSSYSKTCSKSVADLRVWARSATGSDELQECSHCM